MSISISISSDDLKIISIKRKTEQKVKFLRRYQCLWMLHEQYYNKDIANILPEYCVIQYRKFGWLENAVTKNIFGSPMFAWIDAGFSRFYDASTVYSFKPSVENKFFIQADAIRSIWTMRLSF